MKRETSAETFHQIISEGLLPDMEEQVYKRLYERGPSTCREIIMIMVEGKQRKFDGVSISPIFARLLKKGTVTEVGTRPCTVTGRRAIVWQTTNTLPVKFEKPKRSKCEHCKGRGYHETQQARLL